MYLIKVHHECSIREYQLFIKIEIYILLSTLTLRWHTILVYYYASVFDTGLPLFVTGFWKTDQIVTLGLFHFIGPANGYTCTLHIHITKLGGLVCFSRASFADPVNS